MALKTRFTLDIYSWASLHPGHLLFLVFGESRFYKLGVDVKFRVFGA